MTSCSQLEALDALVMGELDAEHARELCAHAATCPACTTELAMMTAERELFAARAVALDVLDPPPSVSWPATTSPASARRILPALGRIAMRGHFTAACAAALFVVVALSRIGTASMSMSMNDGVVSMSTDEGDVGSGMLASYYRGGEPLACGLVGSGSRSSSGASGASGVMMRDDGDMASSSSGVSRGELLACGAGGGAVASITTSGVSCEPSVTCSALRQ